MKTKLLLTTLAFASVVGNLYGENDPVLMKINGQEIKKSEFEYIYRKNSQQQVSGQKDLDEYVDLFVNFKLKVAEAEQRGIDTTQAFMKELAGYRRQLAQPYLVDKQIDDALALEAYNRLKENVEVSHILLALPPNATSEQEQAVYNKLMGYKKQLESGSDFGKLAKAVSEDPSAQQNNGFLGFISGFMTVYPFETAAYNTPVGSISDPVRTDFGYHLVKVTARRQDPGEILTAHIMKMVPRNVNAKQEQAIRTQIDSIYAQLIQGADFNKMAKEQSEDKGSAEQGGLLPWVGCGRMVPEFEKEAFALTEKGAISKPFRTAFGWHIVTLLDRRGIAPFESKKAEIMRRIARDERGTKGHDVLVARLKKEYGCEMQQKGEAFLSALASKYSPLDSAYLAQATEAATPLVRLADRVYTTKDFASFITNNRHSQKSASLDILTEKKIAFVDQTVIAYEDSQLEHKYPDFRNLMREYRDGILLFEVSNKEVWEKASQDIDGLKSYFKKNKKTYRWDAPKFKGFVIECKDEAVKEEARRIIKKAPADSIAVFLQRTFNNDSTQLVRVQKGLFAQGDNPMVDALTFEKMPVESNENFPVVFLSGKKLKKGPESYEDVRGLVTADYQTYLEKIWIEKLKKENSVEINEDVLKTVKPL